MESEGQAENQFWRFLSVTRGARKKRRPPSQSVNIPLVTLSPAPNQNEEREMDIVRLSFQISIIVLIRAVTVVKVARRSYHFVSQQAGGLQLPPAMLAPIQKGP